MPPPEDKIRPDNATLPGWLREAYATTIDAALADIVRQAKRGMKGHGENDVGIIADQRIKGILAEVGSARPSESTAAAYRRDHEHMIERGQTPLAKATTFQHWNRLRSAWKFAEVEAIRALRREAESARKSKEYARMRAATVAAYERAILLESMFLASPLSPTRQTWGRKASALRAAGIGKRDGKSKRAAGRLAPTPDQLLVMLSNQRRRCVRVEIAASVFACFGVRPAELRDGAHLYVDGDGLGLKVCGAKVDASRGQAVRELVITPHRIGCSGLAVALLRHEVMAGRSHVAVSAADLAAVRRAMRMAQAGLSPYAYRHARASDAKAAHGARGAAAWLGHRTDRAQSGYGNSRSSQGVVIVKTAATATPVRAIKVLPQDRCSALIDPIPRHSTQPPSAPSQTVRARRWSRPRLK